MKVLTISVLTILLGFNSAWSRSTTQDSSLYPISDKLLWMSGVSSPSTLKSGIRRAQACLETPSNTPLCELTLELQKSAYQSSDISPLFKSTVLYVGEKHITSEARYFLIRHLQQLRDHGFTTLAMEMWNSSSQADIDLNINSRFNLAWIQENFSKHWSYESSTYIELMTEAHRLGLRILALDSRDTIDSRAMSFAEGILLRDREMADVIAAELQKNPEQKIIALTGKFHAYTHLSEQGEQLSQPELLLQKKHVAISSVILVGKRDASPLNFVANALNFSGLLIKTQPKLHFSDYIYIQD